MAAAPAANGKGKTAGGAPTGATRGRGGRGRGRGRTGREGRPKKSLEDLDAEMEDYNKQSNADAPAPSAT